MKIFNYTRPLICLIALLIPASVLYSQNISATSVQVRLLEEIDWPDGDIREWRFADWGSGGLPNYFVAGENRLLLNTSGQSLTLAAEPYQVKTVFSAQGKYAAVLRLAGQLQGGGDAAILLTEVFEQGGSMRYTITREKYYDDGWPVVAISDADGSLIAGRSETGELWFYDRNGRLTAEKTLFANAAYDHERVMEIVLNPAGDRIAVLAGRRGSSPRSGEAANYSADPHIFLFSPSAEEVWRTPIGADNSNRLAISTTGEVIVANGYNVLEDDRVERFAMIYDGSGKRIRQSGLLFKYAAISADAQTLALADNRILSRIASTGGSAPVDYEINQQDGIICALQISADGRRIALISARPVFENNRFIMVLPVLHILGEDESQRTIYRFSHDRFFRASMQTNADLTRIQIGFQNGAQLLEVAWE